MEFLKSERARRCILEVESARWVYAKERVFERGSWKDSEEETLKLSELKEVQKGSCEEFVYEFVVL